MMRARISAVGLALMACAAAVAASDASTPQAVDDLRKQTAQVRQLTLLGEPPVDIVERPAMREVLDRGLSRVGLSRDLPDLQKLYQVLGLVPRGYALRTGLLDILADEVDGLYQPEEQRIYLVADSAGMSGRDKIVVAHELAHALQDQHFNLKLLLPDSPDNLDRSAAVQALVEGDALVTQLRWGRQFLTPEEKLSLGGSVTAAARSTAVAGAPLVVRVGLSFPYAEGATFVHMLHDRGGHAAVNQAFYEPPVSTEQVLHPEKYFRREGPRQLLMPDLATALGWQWKTLRTNILGELGIRTLLEQHGTRDQAAPAAAGWDGDLYALLEDTGGRLIVAIVTAWDTEPEAAEFYAAFLPTVSAGYGTAALRVLDQPSLVRWSTPTGLIQVLKTGDQVRVIYAPDAFTLASVDAQF